MRRAGQPTLTPDDWARAALAAIGRGGLDAVSVETVAAELDATKGSFYWHFKNRDALIDAALQRWEQNTTESTIAKLEQEPDPAQRLRKLLSLALGHEPNARAEIALLGNPDSRPARGALRHAAKRRLDWMAAQFGKLGWAHDEAHVRAVLAYYLFLGHLQMSHIAPEAISEQVRRRQVELILDSLIVPAPRPRGRSGRRSTRVSRQA